MSRQIYKMELNETSGQSHPTERYTVISEEISMVTQNRPKSEIFAMIRKCSVNNNDSNVGSNGGDTVISVDQNPKNVTEETKSKILKPGSKIKPEVSNLDVEKFAERLYGITPNSIKELISYDDRNFLIEVDPCIKNPILNTNWPHGYVLKILNSLDSEKVDFISAQTELMLHLKENGINCSNPVKNVYGKYYSLERLNDKDHIVRLLEFIPGELFHQVEKTKHIYYQCGEYIAHMDKILKKFDHDAYKTHKSLWHLQEVPKLKDFLYVLQDHSRKAIVEEIIESFENKVLADLDKFESGIIHGDFNEQNILVKIPKDEKDYRIIGIIDFGDTQYSPLIFELAIAMTYMMIQAKDLATGGIVMAGYSSVRLLDSKEKSVLKQCIAARLCQSLVLGAYTHSLDPENDYVLTTQSVGWDLLESLWRVNLQKIDEIWDNTADEYLKQSVK